MKKLMLATLALAAFATTSFAQLSSENEISYNSRATDQENLSITVNIPNVLILAPDAPTPLSANAVFNYTGVGGNFGTTYLGSTTWTVWSNREWFVYYNVPQNFTYTNTTGAYDDGDENNTLPASMMQLRVSNMHAGAGSSNHASSYANAVHATTVAWASSNHAEGSSIGNGTELIEEGQVGDQTMNYFTTDFQLRDPSYNYVGGRYNITFTIWAIQE